MNLTTFLSESRFRRIRIALMVVAIFVVLEIGVRIFFARPGIVVRNEENNPQAMPYLLAQYHKHKGIKIACIGSSVMQGYLNSWDDRAFPAMAEKILRKKYGYKNLKTFNFATAGNAFGDHLCVMNRVLKDDPDLIVHAVHFKLFSSFRPTPIARTENTFYLLGNPEITTYLQRFNVSTRDWVKIYLSGEIGEIWHTYGYRDLISLLLFGTKKVPQKEIAEKFHELFGFVSQEAILARLNTPEEHNQEYLWKLLPQVLVAKHYEICGNFDFTDSNPNWVSFTDGAKLAALNNQSVMYFINPINRPFVEEMNFFNWERVVPVMKERVYQVSRQYDHQLLDYSQAVNPAYFSDTDHINMAGHKQVASRLAKDIDRRLQNRRKHRSDPDSKEN